MLTVFDGATGYPILDDKYYVRLLASGLDEIIFNVSIRDPVYKFLVEEARIRDRDGNYYLVKQIDAGSESAKIVAQIDIDAFKSAMFQKYTNGSATVYSTVLQVLPSGWSIIDYAAKSFKRTIPTSDTTSDYNVTAWDVLQACCTTYSVRFRFDNVKKIVYIIDPDTYINIGAFATRDLNLKELNFKGKSTGFVTRLYAEGADGLTFASINSGKAYVDNNEYSNKVISYYWKDERYTDAQSLLDDATEKLAELAKPTRSYDCDVLDLANTNPEKYGFEDFSLFNVITLIDDAQERRLDYQIVEKWEYPYYPVNNKVVLSTETPKIQNQVVSLIDSVNNPTSTFQQIMQSAIANSTALITGNKGGYVVFHDSDGDGKPDEILIMNTPTIETATKVWRWNSGGLGYSKNGYNGNYGLAMTIDGAIVADFITTGSLTANIIKAGILTDLKGKFSLDMVNGTLTMKDGTFSGTINASTINGGTITGSTIQNAKTGSRVLMDSSSSLKGYYGDVLHNIINMSNRNNENNDLIIDADHQLHIRTPKVYVTNTSAGTGETTVYETYNNYDNGYSFVSDVYKRQSNEYFLKGVTEDEADVLCMLPVLLTAEWTTFKIRHGMLLSGATTRSSNIT
jgi:phage minor structural protein